MSATEPSIIRIMCPNLRCQCVLAVPAAARGKVVKCRSCGTMVRVPIPKTMPRPAPAPPAGTAEPAATTTKALPET